MLGKMIDYELACLEQCFRTLAESTGESILDLWLRKTFSIMSDHGNANQHLNWKQFYTQLANIFKPSNNRCNNTQCQRGHGSYVLLVGV